MPIFEEMSRLDFKNFGLSPENTTRYTKESMRTINEIIGRDSGLKE